MKKIMILIFMTFYLATMAQHGGGHGGGGGHASSHSGSESHSSAHESSGSHEGASHESSSRPSIYEGGSYTRVSHISEEEIRTVRINNVMIYYILLFNHHTNKTDTIKAYSKEELRNVVESNGTNVGRICLIILAIVVVAGSVTWYLTG